MSDITKIGGAKNGVAMLSEDDLGFALDGARDDKHVEHAKIEVELGGRLQVAQRQLVQSFVALNEKKNDKTELDKMRNENSEGTFSWRFCGVKVSGSLAKSVSSNFNSGEAFTSPTKLQQNEMKLQQNEIKKAPKYDEMGDLVRYKGLAKAAFRPLWTSLTWRKPTGK